MNIPNRTYLKQYLSFWAWVARDTAKTVGECLLLIALFAAVVWLLALTGFGF